MLFATLQRPVRFSFKEYFRPSRDAEDQLGRKVSIAARLLHAKRHSTRHPPLSRAIITVISLSLSFRSKAHFSSCLVFNPILARFTKDRSIMRKTNLADVTSKNDFGLGIDASRISMIFA